VGIIAIGGMSPWIKKLLWTIFLALTSLILIYPVNLGLETFVVWSPDIFPNLPLFSILFYLWAILLVVLLFAADEGKGKWERLALIMIAALVFRGYWNIIAPMQGEAVRGATHTMVWESFGHIVRHPTASYIDWPGTFLSGSSLHQITGLELFPSIAILNAFISVVIGIATYIFLLGVLKSSLPAALASLLIIVGNLAMINYYQPGCVAIVFVVLFLARLFQKGSLETVPGLVVTLILLAGVTITHLHSAMHFFFFLLGLWALSLLRNRQPGFRPSIVSLLLFFIVPVAWILYWGTSGFSYVSQGIGALLTGPFDIMERLTGVFTIGEANLGEVVPLWYRTTRLVWLVLLYAAGGLLWLWGLGKFRRLDPIESKLCAVFFGLVLISLISCLVSPRGFAELLRALTYIPFFTVPLLLLFLHRFRPSVTKAALVGLAFLLVVLALPSFLANNSRINSDTSHPIEFAPGKWLQSLYSTGEEFSIFTTASAFRPIQFYLFDASYTGERQTHEAKSWTEASLWQAMDELLQGFERSSQSGQFAFFIQSPKEALRRSMSFNVPYDHPHWAAISAELSERYINIYNNGPIQIYSSRR
jgi:hypothetical protein